MNKRHTVTLCMDLQNGDTHFLFDVSYASSSQSMVLRKSIFDTLSHYNTCKWYASDHYIQNGAQNGAVATQSTQSGAQSTQSVIVMLEGFKCGDLTQMQRIINDFKSVPNVMITSVCGEQTMTSIYTHGSRGKVTGVAGLTSAQKKIHDLCAGANKNKTFT